MDKAKPCGCPGPLCGQMAYGEIEAKMVELYVTREQDEFALKRMHNKWKRLAAEL